MERKYEVNTKEQTSRDPHRNKVIRFRVSEEEEEAINREVRKTGCSREQYLRLVTLLKTSRAKPPADFAGVLRELTRITLALKELAKQRREDGVSEIKSYVTEVEELMSRLIREVTS